VLQRLLVGKALVTADHQHLAPAAGRGARPARVAAEHERPDQQRGGHRGHAPPPAPRPPRRRHRRPWLCTGTTTTPGAAAPVSARRTLPAGPTSRRAVV